MDALKLRYQRDPPPIVYDIPPQRNIITRKPYAPQADVQMKPKSRTEINCAAWVNETNWTKIETMNWTSSNKTKDGITNKKSFEYLFLLRCPFELETAKKICASQKKKLLSIESLEELNELLYYMGVNEIAKEWDEGLKSSPALLSFSGRYIWTDYITQYSVDSFPASREEAVLSSLSSAPVPPWLPSRYCNGSDKFEWRENLGNNAQTFKEISKDITDKKLPVVFDFNKENSNADIGCAKFVWPELPPDTRNIQGKTNTMRLPQYYTVCRSL